MESTHSCTFLITAAGELAIPLTDFGTNITSAPEFGLTGVPGLVDCQIDNSPEKTQKKDKD